MHRIVFACLLALPLGIHAEVFKCTDKKGNIVYQDYHCAPGTAQSDVVVSPAIAVPGKSSEGKAGSSSPARTREPDQPVNANEGPSVTTMWERFKKWLGGKDK